MHSCLFILISCKLIIINLILLIIERPFLEVKGFISISNNNYNNKNCYHYHHRNRNPLCLYNSQYNSSNDLKLNNQQKKEINTTTTAHNKKAKPNAKAKKIVKLSSGQELITGARPRKGVPYKEDKVPYWSIFRNQGTYINIETWRPDPHAEYSIKMDQNLETIWKIAYAKVQKRIGGENMITFISNADGIYRFKYHGQVRHLYKFQNYTEMILRDCGLPLKKVRFETNIARDEDIHPTECLDSYEFWDDVNDS